MHRDAPLKSAFVTLALFWACATESSQEQDAAPQPDSATGDAEECASGYDEDGDGLVDCADDDCALLPECAPRELCTNGIDDDRDGIVDCPDDDCAFATACDGRRENRCTDLRDDDADGLVDCHDPECRNDPACAAEALCEDGLDNDGDGDADCEDGDCGLDAGCDQPGEDCATPGDEEGDGGEGCLDPECLCHGPGEACAEDGECTSGDCLRESEARDWTDGYCMATCGGADDCPEGTVCLDPFGVGNERWCMTTCVRDRDCRTGYECRVVEGEDICFPVGAFLP